MGTRVPSCGEIRKLCKRYFEEPRSFARTRSQLLYFAQIMKMNFKIKALMKVGTDDEIDEKKCSYFFHPFPIYNFFGVNLGKFQDIWIFLKAVLNFT